MPAVVKISDIDFSGQALIERPEHAAVLGRIFTSWSLIEGTVAGLLGLMMHADARAAVAILSTFRSNSSRVNAVKKVGKEMLDPSAREAFNALMKEVLDYAEERNAIAHNLWGVKEGEPDLIYRMPMATYSNFVVRLPHTTDFDVQKIIDDFESNMTAFTVAGLEELEQRGMDVHDKVMREMTSKSNSRYKEKNSVK